MKKKLALLIPAVIAFTVLSYAAATSASQYIGEENAKSVALENAGVTADTASFIKTHLEKEHGVVVYDVEFYTENTEYDYEIDALTGAVLEYDYEIEYFDPQQVTPAVTDATVKTTADQYIGDAKAKEIALADAGLKETDVRKMDIERDYEHGTVIYEVEFKSGRYEYEYEINATDGSIVKSKVEYDD